MTPLTLPNRCRCWPNAYMGWPPTGNMTYWWGWWVCRRRRGWATPPPLPCLGVYSLSAVELRNRLKTATGLTLPPTLIFDHPTPTAAADYISASILRGQLAG